MKMLYIGYLIDEQECLNRKGTSIAGNKMQAGLLYAIKKIKKVDLTILTIVPTAPFPTEKQIFFRYKKTRVMDLILEKVPFVNIQGIKQVTQIISMIMYLFYWAIKNRNHSKVLMCYNANLSTGFIAYIAKKLFSIKTICFVADPVCDVVEHVGLKKLFWEPFKDLSNSLLKLFTGLIVVNKNTILEYAPSSPFIVMEGAFFPKDYSKNLELKPYNQNNTDKYKYKVFFAGALYEYNGIKLILEAAEKLEQIRDDIEFQIYGDGECKGEIVNASSRLSNLNYLGLKPNYIIRQKMLEADILLNIRTTSDSISRYTFPSKIIEYMLSGKAIISTNIDGISEEYLQYLYILHEENSNDLISLIEDIIDTDNEVLNDIGIQAKQFMFSHKTWDETSIRISDFIESIDSYQT